ncbi:hypothetical protein DBV15_11334 [Temnothorax longispinosus]|uniref:Uncharacterized protein n=1 Tax=Temnothorax longispinosus TaxID=300112 RepID=A0A4V3S8V5_9HYME|nr:hypothetical protein DBV15_11334 [Temnothorax longispinosus]
MARRKNKKGGERRKPKWHTHSAVNVRQIKNANSIAPLSLELRSKPIKLRHKIMNFSVKSSTFHFQSMTNTFFLRAVYDDDINEVREAPRAIPKATGKRNDEESASCGTTTKEESRGRRRNETGNHTDVIGGRSQFSAVREPRLIYKSNDNSLVLPGLFCWEEEHKGSPRARGAIPVYRNSPAEQLALELCFLLRAWNQQGILPGYKHSATLPMLPSEASENLARIKTRNYPDYTGPKSQVESSPRTPSFENSRPSRICRCKQEYKAPRQRLQQCYGMLVMWIRVPGKFALETSNRLRDVRGDEEKERERKKRETLGCLGALAHAIDITQAVALNDYDTVSRARAFSQPRQKVRDTGKCRTAVSCGVAATQVQQERRFRIVRPTGNPDEPLRFRHASPRGEEPRARRCYTCYHSRHFPSRARSIREVARGFGDDEEEVAQIEILRKRTGGKGRAHIKKSNSTNINQIRENWVFD